MSVLIKGGRIVTAADDYVGDVFVDNGTVTLIGQSLDVSADKVIDAAGKYVIPGAIDPHTHIEMSSAGRRPATTSRPARSRPRSAAPRRSSTSACRRRATTFAQALENYHEKIDRCKPVIDVGFHIGDHRPPRGRHARGPREAAGRGRHVLQAVHGLQGRRHGRRRDALQDDGGRAPRPARS